MFKLDCKSYYKFFNALYCYNFLHSLYILIIVFIKICFTLHNTIVCILILVGSRHNSDDILTGEITYNILTDALLTHQSLVAHFAPHHWSKSSLEHMFDNTVAPLLPFFNPTCNSICNLIKGAVRANR